MRNIANTPGGDLSYRECAGLLQALDKLDACVAGLNRAQGKRTEGLATCFTEYRQRGRPEERPDRCFPAFLAMEAGVRPACIR